MLIYKCMVSHEKLTLTVSRPHLSVDIEIFDFVLHILLKIRRILLTYSVCNIIRHTANIHIRLSVHIDDAVSATPSREAREAMLQGSMLAGMAFANAPVAAVHALAYPLGGHFHVPHGHSNALVLIEVLKFNRDAAVSQYAELGRAILPDEKFANDDAACDRFIAFMTDMVERMPFSRTLREVGVAESDLDMLATDAMKVERLLINNPREMTFEAARAIYAAVL